MDCGRWKIAPEHRTGEGGGKLLRRVPRVVIASFAFALTIALILTLLWATNVFGWRAWRIQEAQNFIGAPLPEGAADVRFATQNSVGRIVWLRAALPPDADLSPFLSEMGITDPLRAGFTPFPAPNPQEAAYNWWTPSASTSYEGLYWNTGDKIIELLLDRSDTRELLVYVRAYALTGG